MTGIKKIINTLFRKKEIRYTYREYVNDAQLREDDQNPSPAPEGMYYRHAIGHIRLKEDKTVFILKEELGEYASSLNTLYAIPETFYHQLKEKGCFSGEDRDFVLKPGTALLMISAQSMGPAQGRFFGQYDKPWFDDREVQKAMDAYRD